MSDDFFWSTFTGAWDPEGEAEHIAFLAEHIPTLEDNYERWGAECELEWRREAHLRHCGRRWPEEDT